MKTLCELTKKLPDNLLFFIDQANQANYICSKCGRLATIKDIVCKPNKISKLKGEE